MSHDNEECCRDELFRKLMDYGIDGLPDYNFGEETIWFLSWARRRESQVAEWLIEVLNAIATEDFNNVAEIQDFARKMLGRYAQEKKVNPTGRDAVKDA